MLFRYDEEARALYVYFDHPDAQKRASVKRTVVDYWPDVNLDIGYDDKPIGLEFLNVSERPEKEDS